MFKQKQSVEKTQINQSNLAMMALNNIGDGVLIVNAAGKVQFVNLAALRMLNCNNANDVLGLDYGLVIKIKTKDDGDFSDAQNPLNVAIKTEQPLMNFIAILVVSRTGKRIPVAISVLPVRDAERSQIITFRDVAEQLKEEGEQAEFISTASHEMRTPVASIEGYLSLALNPQTATIDERARGYLEAAHLASQHLGHLFRDLLDVTRLDDGRLNPRMQPLELVGAVKQIADGHLEQFNGKKLKYQFGGGAEKLGGMRKMQQVVYGFVDVGFLREIIDNLVDNAIKYTPEGGSVYVNVFGDNDRALINVTDTGMGIAADDLQHIFQKFYRSDNSQTREIGGTGLGLYLVKQRAEAMGGKVWAESAFGEGSTFYVSLPRISGEEYEKRLIAVRQQGGNI